MMEKSDLIRRAQISLEAAKTARKRDSGDLARDWVQEAIACATLAQVVEDGEPQVVNHYHDLDRSALNDALGDFLMHRCGYSEIAALDAIRSVVDDYHKIVESRGT